MGTILQQTLRSLCCGTAWNYAVFWKLKRRSRMMFSWEDAYYEQKKVSSVSSAHILPNLPLNGMESGRNTHDDGVSSPDGCSVGDQIGLAVAKMSYQVFSLGEGIIGHVAFTGKHQWVFGDKNCTHEGNSIGAVNGHIEYPIAWQNQFAAGIKTIAVVAVEPHGVVQLGSTQVIMEDLELVNSIKTLFGTLQNVPGAFLPDSIQDSLSGKIQGSILRSISLPLNSPGNPPSSGAMSSLRGQPNQSVKRVPSSSVLDLVSLLAPVGMNKSLNAQTSLLPSRENVGASSKSLGHPSPFQKNSMQINSLLPLVTSGQGIEMGGTEVLPSSARVVYPFQGKKETNVPSFYNPPSRFMVAGTISNNYTHMEQQVPKKIGLQGPLQLVSTNVQNGVQSQFCGNMTSDFSEEYVINSAHGNVESNITGILCEDNFNMSTMAEGQLGAALFNPGRPQLRVRKQIDVKPSVPLFHDSGLSTASSRPCLRANQITETNTNPKIGLRTDAGSIPYKAVPFSCANIQTSASNSSQPSDASWSVSAGYLDTGMLAGDNGLMPSLGNDGISMSEALGMNHQPWHREILAKNMSDPFCENMVSSMNPVNQISKGSEGGFAEQSDIPTDCDEPGRDGPHDFDTEGQSNTTYAISGLSAAAELFEALGPAFKKEPDRGIWDNLLFPREDVCNANLCAQKCGVAAGSDCLSEMDTTQNVNASIDRGMEGWFLSETKSADLLDAVVANVCSNVNQSTGDDISCNTEFSRLNSTPSLYCASVRTESSSAGQLSGYEQKQSKVVVSSQFRENADLGNCANSSFTSGFHEEVPLKRSPIESPSNTQPNSWVDEGQCEKPVLVQAKRPEEPMKVNRKRARPGESSRPRPKDRQQIQDRVRELREIVPNGAKCSIDALLERTIKHMLFLQSVTKYADKLKQTGESKVLCKEGGLLATDNLEGGASWAFELGGQTLGCPIIVENLNQPRQMLVEMLCEERGLFLEIADIIRSFGLTILKGVMEARNDKVWAHFVVEANRDVHRLEILWSLMQLLKPNAKNSSTITNQSSLVRPQCIDSVSQTFDTFQQSPIPTFSMPKRL
eukprot:Gb_14057 [translate_table: standard]